jgi:hypothetical protein
MTDQDRKQLATSFIEALRAGDANGFRSIMTDDVPCEQGFPGGNGGLYVENHSFLQERFHLSCRRGRLLASRSNSHIETIFQAEA